LLLRPALLASAFVVGGCMTVLDHPAPPSMNASAAFSATLPASGADSATAAQPDWWHRAVPEPVYTALEHDLAANPDLHKAAADVDAARALWRQSQADAGPRLELSAGASVQHAADRSTDGRFLGMDGGLPIDVSGALARRTDAARQALRASSADAARLRSDLARDYLIALIDGAEASRRQALLLRQIDLAATLLHLIELRFTQGLVSSVDVLQQRDQLAALRQQLPLAQLDELRAANQLRLIGARTPNLASPLLVEPLPQVSGLFDTVVPIDLLERRPALRASRARLAAADARFAAALADRWPTLQLSGVALTRALSGDVSTILGVALDGALTLFDSGSKLEIAAERRARLVAAGQQYLSDWLAAVIEVDNLIHEEASLREQINLSEQRLDNAQALLIAAQRRYEQGVSDYLPVLEALRGMQQQQRDRLALQADLARTRVRLHRALGSPLAEDQA